MLFEFVCQWVYILFAFFNGRMNKNNNSNNSSNIDEMFSAVNGGVNRLAVMI